MGSDRLEERQRRAHAVALMAFELRWRQQGIDGNYLLQEDGHGAVAVPEDRGEVGDALSFL